MKTYAEQKESTPQFETVEGRAAFINEEESGIYSGKTKEGLTCRVYLDKGKGMSIYTEQVGKPNWWEVTYYDKDGYCEGYSYEYKY